MSWIKTRARRSSAALALAALLVLLAFSLGQAAQPPVKNVIMLIPDGCSAEQYTLARWAKGEPLSFDPILTGMVRTFIADSVVADSAPAATAYATGLRTCDKLIGMGPGSKGLLPGQEQPEGLTMRPLATVLEAARLLGKSTGLVATARVTHATPAAYAAHVDHRDKENDIAKQMAHQGLDVLMGGGRQHFLPSAGGGARQDGLDLLAALQGQGYHTPRDRAELAEVKSGRLLGLFAKSHMMADLDRRASGSQEPSLAEMTAKALELLAKNPKGFFLMVEGSQIDWACHANDPAHLLGDMLAYDQAVAVALNFARRDGRTLLIAVSDHNTGGMSIGNYAHGKTYSQTKLEPLLAPLRAMKITARPLWGKLGDQPNSERLREEVKRWWGIDLNEEEASQILALAEKYGKSPEYALAEVVSARHTQVGWTSHGHAGGDVPLFAYGPGRPAGLLEAPQVAQTIAKALGVNLRALDQRLFAEAGQLLPGAGLSEENGPQGWRLQVSKGAKQAVLENGSNLLTMAGKTTALEGPAVRVEQTGRWYLPRQAAFLIGAAQAKTPAAAKAAGAKQAVAR